MAIKGSTAKEAVEGQDRPTRRALTRRSGFDPVKLGAAQKYKQRKADVASMARAKDDANVSWGVDEVYGPKDEELPPLFLRSGILPRTLGAAQKIRKTKEAVAKLREDHQEYYDESGNFKDSPLPGPLHTARFSALTATSGLKGGSIDADTLKAAAQGDGEASGLSEEDFAVAFYTNKAEDAVFEEAVKGWMISTVPVWSTVHFWDDMGPKMKTFSIVMDAMAFATIFKGVPIPAKGVAVGAKAQAAARAHNRWLIDNFGMYDKALNLAGELSTKQAAIKALNSRFKYADALAELEEIRLQGRYPTGKTGTLARGVLTDEQYAAKINKATDKLDEAADAFETDHNKLLSNLETSKARFGDGSELAELGQKMSPPASAGEILADTKKFVEGYIDEYPEVKIAAGKVDASFDKVRKTIHAFKSKDPGPIGMGDATSERDVANAVTETLKAFVALREANKTQAQILRGRMDDLVSDMERPRLMGAAEAKALRDRTNSLRNEIFSLDSFDAKQLQNMQSLLNDVTSTFPKDRTKWTPEMKRIGNAHKAVKLDIKTELKNMDKLWEAGGEWKGGGGGGGGGPLKTPIPPKSEISALDDVLKGSTIQRSKSGLPSPNIQLDAVAHFGPDASLHENIKPGAELFGAAQAWRAAKDKGAPGTKTEPTIKPSVVPTDFPEGTETDEGEKVSPFKPQPIVVDDIPTPEVVPEEGLKIDEERETGKGQETLIAEPLPEPALKLQTKTAGKPRKKPDEEPFRPFTPRETAVSYSNKSRHKTKAVINPEMSKAEKKALKESPQYKRMIKAELGAVNILADLKTGEVSYYPRPFPSKRKPGDTLEVLAYMGTPPEAFTHRQGLYDMIVTPDDISFRPVKGPKRNAFPRQRSVL